MARMKETRMNIRWLVLPLLLVTAALANPAQAGAYEPVEGGWRIQIPKASNPPEANPAAGIGVPVDNARQHRRPLYPPADKSMLWTQSEREKMAHCAFRPLVLAYNEPRFLFDFHGAGGLLGHLYIGLHQGGAPGKWLHQWATLEVAYIDGRMEYTLSDPDFPGVTARVEAIALAGSAGLLLKLRLEGLQPNTSLTWAYGGASAFFTNWAMNAPEFSFSPPQCAKDQCEWKHSQFLLTRAFDKSDSIMEQAFAVPRFLPEWKARIQGGSSFSGYCGFGRPAVFQESPGALVGSAEWTGTGTTAAQNRVLLEECVLRENTAEGYVIVGMGGDIERALNRPARAWRAARDRNQDIAGRMVTHTPDAWLDAAVPMMAFATDGTWGDSAILHGGWSWRFGYLGWRGWYGSDCYGWSERVRRSIENQIQHGLITKGDDAGAISSMLDAPGGVYYNMNEVFLDHVRHYFEYTDDRELMVRIFHILEGVVDWENRRLQPGGQSLYENALNTWISDGHWYIQGQCAQASAYMLQAHRLLARLAPLAGADPEPYARKAAQIASAMREKLWMARPGVFAEYLDTRGNRMLHTQPELPTLYHTAEFGAVAPGQLYQMLHWADANLRYETTPNAGKLLWSSNWYPNNGRSYTHSTYEMAYAEELNFALTNYLAGRGEEGYALLRATLCGIFNGPTPGGLSCHSYTDGRQRANDEFTDAISMWGRTLTEGLFGIHPNLPEGFVELVPQFPGDWPAASIETPYFSYRWRQQSHTVTVEWESPRAIAVRLRHPVRASELKSATVDGHEAKARLEFTPDISWVQLSTSPARKGTIEFHYAPESGDSPLYEARQGDLLTNLPQGALEDPQGLLEADTTADGAPAWRVTGAPGPGLLFVTRECAVSPWVTPVRLSIAPQKALPAPSPWSPPAVPAHDLSLWNLVDCRPLFNSTISEALERVAREATAPPAGASLVGFNYWKDYLTVRYHGGPTQQPSDAAWRAKVNAEHIAWTTDGIPFKTVIDGPNMAVVSLAGAFPSRMEIPVGASGRTLYLMLSGATYPAQSHVPHLRVTLRHADGTIHERELATPETLSDCWNTWCGRWHDTAINGFENLGGRFGPAGSAEAADLAQPVNVDTEANLVGIELNNDSPLQLLEVECLATDIVYGIMGVTLLK